MLSQAGLSLMAFNRGCQLVFGSGSAITKRSRKGRMIMSRGGVAGEWRGWGSEGSKGRGDTRRVREDDKGAQKE